MRHIFGRRIFYVIKDKEDQPQWKSFILQSLFTFDPISMDCLALDSVRMDHIMQVIKKFKGHNSVFRRAIKPRKHTMLIHGAEGAGKWDTVRAIAHYLKFDIYKFDLRRITNDELKTLVSKTKTNSILVFEGIDHISVNSLFPCLRELCEGDFRAFGHKQLQIFVAEDNNQLDPVFHKSVVQFELDLPYCSPEVFRILAYRILGTTTIQNFEKIATCLSMAHTLTPRRVENMLMENPRDSNATACLSAFEHDLSVTLGLFNVSTQSLSCQTA